MAAGAKGNRAATRWPDPEWPAADPAAAGIDSAALESIDRTAADERPWLDSVVVVRSGLLVWERYYNGNDADTPHQLRSATKSVLAALVGIAIDQGVLAGLDEPIGAHLGAWLPADVDRRKLEITIGDCLRMRSGLEWQEDLPASWAAWMTGPHSLDHPLGAQPCAHSPGDVWRYSTVDSQLVGACLAAAAGCSLLDFADEHLFGPIGVGVHRWDTTIWPGRWDGALQMAGSELYLRSRDLARFGYLHLRGGRWGEGEPVIPEQWVWLSATRQPGLGAAEIGATSEGLLAASRWFNGYGLHWWRGTFGGHDAVAAAGQGGQYCILIADLDLVLVLTARQLIPPEAALLIESGVVDDQLRPAPNTDIEELFKALVSVPGNNILAGQLGGLALADDIVRTAIAPTAGSSEPTERAI